MGNVSDAEPSCPRENLKNINLDPRKLPVTNVIVFLYTMRRRNHTVVHSLARYSTLMAMSRRKRKQKLNLISYIVAAISGIFIIFLYSFSNLFSPLDLQDTQVEQFIVPKGAGATTIAYKLQKQGLIKSPLAFRIAVYRDGLVDRIQAGSFNLSPSQTPSEIAFALTQGRLDSWVTIPEGFRLEQIAETVSSELGVNEDEFLAVSDGLEGMLFPDTYLVPSGASAKKILDIMLANYTKKLAPLQLKIRKSPLSEQEVLTLASIIERETLSDSEKPTVAGILLKRMDNNWALQVDATLQYIKGSSSDWWPTPYAQDKELISPYNTYLNQGLPPAPIANPGLESIQAVLNPKNSNYWFYIHDNNGKIHYGETTEDHSNNISRYLR